MNDENLRPGEYKFTKEDAARGGRRSGETKRRRKAFAEAYEVLLARKFVDGGGNEVMGVDALAARTFQAAMDGDLSAAKHIQASVGEQPVQRIETVEIPQEAYEAVRRALEIAE